MRDAPSKTSLRIDRASEKALFELTQRASAYRQSQSEAESGSQVLVGETYPQPLYDCLKHVVLRHRFRPDDILKEMPESGTDPALRSGLLALCYVVTESQDRLWSLRLESRRKALQAIAERGELEQVFTNASKCDDATAQWAVRIAEHAAPAVSEQNADQLQKTLLALEWLSSVDPNLGSADDAARQLSFVRLVDPLCQLIGRRAGPYTGRLPDEFVGRAPELSRLRDYVGVLPSGKYLSWRRLERSIGVQRNRPFLITGLGGVGKSTLIAKFLVDHILVDEASRVPFAYLDFDRPGVIGTEPVNLLIEIARQLSWQLNTVSAPLAELREELRAQNPRESHTLSPNERSTLSADDVLLSGISQLVTILRQAEVLDRPLLIVFDTFEEVQMRADGGAERVGALIRQLMDAHPGTRTVISGRDDHLDDLPATDEILTLGELDEASALKFLVARGLEKETAEKVVREIGCNPLSLRIASQVVKQFDFESIRRSTWEKFITAFSGQSKNAYLYNRVLNHIANPLLRELANPGLLLRRITRDIIQQVMAPCRDKVLSDLEADEVLESLRKTGWLIESGVPGEVLRHRTDLRKACVPLIAENEPQLAARLHALATKYYRERLSQSPTAEERVEWAYHELAAGDDIERVDREWDDQISEGVSTAMDELSVRGRTYVKARLGYPLSSTEMASLPRRLWQERLPVEAGRLLSGFRVSAARDLIFSRPDFGTDPNALLLAATVLDRAGDWEGAASQWSMFRKHSTRNDVSTLLQMAEFQLRHTSGEAGQRLYYEALDAAGGQDRDDDTMRAYLGLLRSARLAFVEKFKPGELKTIPVEEIYERLGGTWQDISKYFSRWLSRPRPRVSNEILREIVLLGASGSVSLVASSLRNGEMPWLTIKQMDALAEEYPVQSKRSMTADQERQWLVDLRNSEDPVHETKSLSQGARATADNLANLVEDGGSELAELLRPYFRNAATQWYFPLASIFRTIQSPECARIVDRYQEMTGTKSARTDSSKPRASSSMRNDVRFLEILDRRELLIPFLTDTVAIDADTSDLKRLRNRFVCWLTALTGLPPARTSNAPRPNMSA